MLPTSPHPTEPLQQPLRHPSTARGYALQDQIGFHDDPDPAQSGPLPRPPLRVLVVDDDPDIRDLVTLALLDEGYEVVSATDGEQALRRIQSYAPDIILLDMQMPRVDGPTFAQRYHAQPGPHAPIVVFTASGQVDRWVSLVGAAGVVEKPFDLGELSTKLNRLARQHAA